MMLKNHTLTLNAHYGILQLHCSLFYARKIFEKLGLLILLIIDNLYFTVFFCSHTSRGTLTEMRYIPTSLPPSLSLSHPACLPASLPPYLRTSVPPYLPVSLPT